MEPRRSRLSRRDRTVRDRERTGSPSNQGNVRARCARPSSAVAPAEARRVGLHASGVDPGSPTSRSRRRDRSRQLEVCSAANRGILFAAVSCRTVLPSPRRFVAPVVAPPRVLTLGAGRGPMGLPSVRRAPALRFTSRRSNRSRGAPRVVAIDREKVLAAAQKYVEKKKYDRAVIEYQKVIQEDPNDARTLLKIGDLQSKMEAYADAVATYERVGKFYASQGFALKAIAVYKQIREIIAKHVPQLEEKYSHITPKLAELYQQLGLTSDALAALDEVATRFQRQNRDQEAIDVFRKIVELDPTNPLPHLRLAEALSRVKDSDGAVAQFAIASGQLVKLGRRDDALKVTERLLHHKADPSHARIAAELYLARNQPNDGLQALSKLQICFQANPRDLDTLGLLAKSFNQIGQAAKAIEVQKEMARIARDSGKGDLFREILTRLLKLAPNDEQVRQFAMGSMAPPALASSLPPAPLRAARTRAGGSRRRRAARTDACRSSDDDVVRGRGRRGLRTGGARGAAARALAAQPSPRGRRRRRRRRELHRGRRGGRRGADVRGDGRAGGAHPRRRRLVPPRALLRQGDRDAAHRARGHAAVDRGARDAPRSARGDGPGRRLGVRDALPRGPAGRRPRRGGRGAHAAGSAGHRPTERARDRDAAGARLRAGRGAGVRAVAGGGAPASDAARVPQHVELRPGGAAAVLRPRGDRAGGRRAALLLRAEHAHGARGGADARLVARRHGRPLRRRGAVAELPARSAAGERGRVRARRRAHGRDRRLRVAARPRRGPIPRAARAGARRRSSSRRSRRPSSSRRGASTTTRGRSSRSSWRVSRTTRSSSSAWRSSTRRSAAPPAGRARGRRPPRPGRSRIARSTSPSPWGRSTVRGATA